MNSTGLNAQQVERLAASVKRMRHYLDVLTSRMHQRHFPRDDPLNVSANKAFNAVAELMVEVERMQQAKDDS